MAHCSVCGTDSPASARYCPNCANVLGDANSPLAFKAGRIAALESVKSEIIKWLGVPIAILTGVVGLLGYLGISNTITSEVQSQVEKEIRDHFKLTADAITKRFIKISTTEARINAHEKTARHMLDDLKNTQKELTIALQSDKDKERELENDLTSEKMRPFLAALHNDFYYLSDFAVSGFVKFERSTSPDTSFPHAEYVKLVGDSNDSVGSVQLNRNTASTESDVTGNTGINIQFTLPVTEQDKVIGKKVDILAPLNRIQLVFFCQAQYRAKLESMTKMINAVYLSVRTNDRRLEFTEISKPSLQVEQSSEGDWATFVINMKLGYSGDTIRSAYDALFDHEESQQSSGTQSRLLSSSDPRPRQAAAGQSQ
jgi:hypothetical protein